MTYVVTLACDVCGLVERFKKAELDSGEAHPSIDRAVLRVTDAAGFERERPKAFFDGDVCRECKTAIADAATAATRMAIELRRGRATNTCTPAAAEEPTS